MKHSDLLGRLHELNSCLDELIEFYTPNLKAISEASRDLTSATPKAAWKKVFRDARLRIAKPAEKPTAAAVRASNGKVYRHANHPLAAMDLQYERPRDFGWLTRIGKRAERASGFVTNQQPFVSANEATQIAKRRGWSQAKQPWRARARPGLHSSDLEDLG